MRAPIIWLWPTAFFAPASPVRSAELGSSSNGRLDPESSRGSSGQPVACQSAVKNLSSKTARLACLNYLLPSSSAVTSIGLNCGVRDCSVDRNSLQLCVIRLRFYQDGDVGIGVFPEGEKGPIGSLCLAFSPESAHARASCKRALRNCPPGHDDR
jgi:hypothetical protein